MVAVSFLEDDKNIQTFFYTQRDRVLHSFKVFQILLLKQYFQRNPIVNSLGKPNQGNNFKICYTG